MASYCLARLSTVTVPPPRARRSTPRRRFPSGPVDPGATTGPDDSSVSTSRGRRTPAGGTPARNNGRPTSSAGGWPSACAPTRRGLPFLRVVAVAVVDGRHARLGVVQDLPNHDPVDTRARHHARGRATQVVPHELHSGPLPDPRHRLGRELNRLVFRGRRREATDWWSGTAP